MLDAIFTVGLVSLAVFASTCAQSAWLYFRGDRTGLSGRFGHELDNRRIDGPDDLPKA